MVSGLPPVLFVMDKLGYPGGVAHGGGTYLLHVLPELAEAGMDVTACILRDPHPLADMLRERGIPTISLSCAPADPSVVLRLASIARQNDCAILHAAGVKATLMARLATRLVPARTIVHVHDLVHPGLLLGNLHRACARKSDLGVCVSRAAVQTTVDGYHVSPDRVRVIHNGIQLKRFRGVPADTRAAVRQELGIPGQSRVLGMYARMYPVKGHRAMLRMMPRIVEACPDVVLLLAGDGPERGPCETLVAELGLRGHVIFLGQRDDVPELLAACDVFLVPSESEGLCLGAVEALAMARPVVAFDVGGVGEVVDEGETGRLVPFGDADAFVSAVLSLLLDAEKLSAFGRRAWHAAGRFSVENHVGRLMDCYRELAHGNEARPSLVP